MNAILTIKNFGPIKDAELDLRRFNVFIGKQGEGKSTVAKLIAIFHDVNFIMIGDKMSQFSFYNIQSYFQDNSYLKFENEFYIFEYIQRKFQVTTKEKLSWLLLTSEKSIIKNKEKLDSLESELIELSKTDASPEKIKIVTERNEKIKLEMVDHAPFGRKNNQYIPAERVFISMISNALYGLVTNDISLPKFFTSFGNEFAKARREIKELIINELGIMYKFVNGLDKIYKDNNSLNLSESASGIQSLIPMALVISYINEQFGPGDFEYIFIIEEPELNLYPTTQKYLLGFFMEKCNARQTGLTLTTHSPYILSCLNNLLFAFRVKNKYPDSEEQIHTIIPKEHWINPDEFNAFYVADGKVRTIFNRETGLIAENELDDISEDLAGERDQLMEIYRIKK